MKIKTKKEMNLPELIEWATENDVRNKSFCSDRYCDEVSFDENKDMTCERITINETFTVEIEEEITEDTKIHKMIELNDKGLLGGTGLYINSTINQAKTNKSLALYILNDDLTMTLIWTKEKELVE